VQCIECIAGELLIDWNPDAGKPSDVTQTFIDVPTDLPRWNGDEDVFHGRRCQSSMESSCLRQRSLDQRQCVSASFSARSSRSDRDSTRRINTEPSTDDFNQFLTVDACNGLSWSHSGDAVKPTFHDADFPETSPDGEWNLGFSTSVVSDLSQQPSRTAAKVDSPAGKDSGVLHLSENTSVPRDSVQDFAAYEGDRQAHSCLHYPPTNDARPTAFCCHDDN